MKRICTAILITFCFSHSAMGEIYTIEDEFDGCEHGKIYPLTNGKFMRCDSYKYFYKYRPKPSSHHPNRGILGGCGIFWGMSQ